MLHNVLLAKMRHLRFSEPVINWFKSYLECREQCVLGVNNVNSDWAANPRGVPQGSVLSSILYSIYTFAISRVLKYCKYHLYADDLQIYTSCRISDINQNIQKINEDIEKLCEWSNIHGLKINAKKPSGNHNWS